MERESLGDNENAEARGRQAGVKKEAGREPAPRTSQFSRSEREAAGGD